MRRERALLLLLTACRPGPDTSESGKTPQGTSNAAVFGGIGHVVWIVPDGTRADESIFDDVSSASGTTPDEILPTLRKDVFPQGTVIRPGLSTGITVTAEAHGTMLTGARVPQANYPCFEGPGHFRPELPTLFELLRKEKGYGPEAVAFVANYEQFEGHTFSVYPTYGADYGSELVFLSAADTPEGGNAKDPADDDGVVMDALLQRLQAADVHLSLTNLHWIDGAAHT